MTKQRLTVTIVGVILFVAYGCTTTAPQLTVLAVNVFDTVITE